MNKLTKTLACCLIAGLACTTHTTVHSRSAAEKFKDAVSSATEAISESVKDAADAVGASAKKAGESAADVVAQGVHTAGDSIKAAADSTHEIAQKALDGAEKAAKDAGIAVAGTVAHGAHAVQSALGHEQEPAIKKLEATRPVVMMLDGVFEKKPEYVALLERTKIEAQIVTDSISLYRLTPEEDRQDEVAFVTAQKGGLVKLFKKFLSLIPQGGGDNFKPVINECLGLAVDDAHGSPELTPFLGKDAAAHFDSITQLDRLERLTSDLLTVISTLSSKVNLPKSFPAYERMMEERRAKRKKKS